MAGMDYGGRAFRNGIHMPQCEDAVVVLKDLPMAPAGTYSYDQVGGDWIETTKEVKGHWAKEPLWYHSHNAVLGDGPVYLALHQQTGYQIYQYGEKDGFLKQEDYGQNLIYRCGSIQDHQIDLYLYRGEANSDLNNHYIFGRLRQPDGTIWTGFSGYACGSGWDDDIKEGWENTQIAQNVLSEIFRDSRVEYHKMNDEYYIEFFNRRLKESIEKYWNNRDIHWEDPEYQDYDISEHDSRSWRRKSAEMDIAEVIVQASQHNFQITITKPDD